MEEVPGLKSLFAARGDFNRDETLRSVGALAILNPPDRQHPRLNGPGQEVVPPFFGKERGAPGFRRIADASRLSLERIAQGVMPAVQFQLAVYGVDEFEHFFLGDGINAVRPGNQVESADRTGPLDENAEEIPAPSHLKGEAIRGEGFEGSPGTFDVRPPPEPGRIKARPAVPAIKTRRAQVEDCFAPW